MFHRKEKEEVTRNRILKLCEDVDCGMCSPPLKAQVAVNELARHLLGEDWYTTDVGNAEQINTRIVYEIERKYKRVKENKK